MKFPQRLAYYLIGLLIGSFAVFYFLDVKDTTFCYLPNCRVLQDIRNKPFHVDDQAALTASKLSKDEIKTFLTHGTVDFDNSKMIKEGGKVYIINGKDKDMKDMTFEMINYTDRVVLKNITYK